MKIKVVHLVENLGVGGLEKVLVEIVLKLNKEKYHVSVWCLREGGLLADRLIEEGVNVKILRISTSRNPIGIYKLYKLIKNHKIELIHTHAYSAGTIGRISAFLYGVSVIISHNHSVHDYYNKYFNFVEWVLSLVADRIICVSDRVKRFANETQGISAKRLITVHNGINDACSVPGKAIIKLKENLGISPEHTVVGTVTHMEEHKGVFYLIQSASCILEYRKDLIFLLVGAGAQEEKLKNFCVDLKIEKNVIFTGERDDIPEILSSIDIFVLPSLREGLPLTILEAMACAKPIIATNVGGIPEAVKDGVSGILVPPKDPESLQNAIVELLDDTEKQETMGLKGKQICDEHFRSRAMVDKIEKLYDLLIKGSSKKKGK